ncbi:PREDICTED: SEC14-like protein 2, partial [Priapulus caudatus]|uniref:SEC14-like protein 2 n=1 Tax=Priapulus caudatus TaxID=37621 RepID=A0ABM1DY83_PRICU
MSGYVGDLDEYQESILEEFKQKVQDIARPHWDNNFYLRWLRARDFDEKRSEVMLRNDVVWRRQFGTEKILEEFKVPEVIEKYVPNGLFGEDKQGYPIMYYYFDLDLKGLVHSASKTDVLKSMIVTMEKVYRTFSEQSKKHQRRIDGLIVVFDLENLAMKHITYKAGVELCIEIIQMFEDHYPETLKTLNIVNAPKIFPVAYAIMKPFLTQHTKDKIRMHGGDWQQNLLREIDIDEIPVFFGGQARGPDGDPKCSHALCYGGEIPQHYYQQKRKEAIDKTKMDMAVVNKRGYHMVEYFVQQPSSLIRWEFITEDNDIIFGIYMKKDGTPVEKLKMSDLTNSKPPQRCNCHL